MSGTSAVLSLEGVRLSPLARVTAQFPAGLHVVLGRPADGTAELIAAISGLARLRRGSVTIDARPLGPGLRRRIGAVLADEDLGPGSVADAVARALRLRLDASLAEHVLRDFALEAWSARSARSLDRRERRRVAMAIALCLREPVLLGIYEPFEGDDGENLDRVERALCTRAESSIVLCATASPRVAARLGGTCRALFRGTLGAPVDVETAALGPSPLSHELLIRTSNVRELARALASDPGVASVSFDETRAPGQLRAAGDDLDKISLAVAHHAVEHGFEIHGLASTWPDLEELRAAEAGAARAAYELSYLQAWQRANYAASPQVAPGTSR